jgi:hypothetical protein
MNQWNVSYTSATVACVVDGDDILQVDMLGNKKAIGKTAAAYSDLESVTNEYYEKLVQLGVIVKPKSQEEMMGEMAKLIADLSAEVKEMKAHGHGSCACHSGQDVPEREPDGSGETG